MPRRRTGYSLVNLFIVLMFIILLAALLLPALGKVREMSRRAKCGRNVNQIAVAQANYATNQNQKGQPEAFVRGTEGFCRADGKPRQDATLGSDASRAFVYLVKQNFIDSFGGYVCPADPFVAALDCPGGNLAKADVDFPAESKPVDKMWASPDSPARQETGHTYYSYSMQAGSSQVQINIGPKMMATLPLASERNPWSEPLPTLTSANPDQNGYPNGNAWNHNREGQSLALRDGTTFFMTDARALGIPLNGRNIAESTYDYLYSDDPVKSVRNESEVFFTGPKYVGVGSDQVTRPAESAWGCYMFD